MSWDVSVVSVCCSTWFRAVVGVVAYYVAIEAFRRGSIGGVVVVVGKSGVRSRVRCRVSTWVVG